MSFAIGFFTLALGPFSFALADKSAMHSLAVALEVVAAAAEHLEVLGYGLAAL